MQHRYIVWEGHYRGRRYTEMHIINREDKPICGAPRHKSTEHGTIWEGRPDGYRLCGSCRQKRPAFEQAEKLRTWQELA